MSLSLWGQCLQDFNGRVFASHCWRIAGVLSKSPSLNDGGGAAEHRENTSGIRTCQQGKLRFLVANIAWWHNNPSLFPPWAGEPPLSGGLFPNLKRLVISTISHKVNRRPPEIPMAGALILVFYPYKVYQTHVAHEL